MNHQTSQDSPIITSKLLSSYPKLCHGISTRQSYLYKSQFGFNLSYNVGDDENVVKLNREKFFTALRISDQRVAFQQQIHSTTVIDVKRPGMYENCDGLVTNVPDLYLAVTAADCIPILLYDPVQRCVGAVHSGWKGTQQNIIQKALHKMMTIYGTSASDILCFIGPGAGECCYNTGEDVAHLFAREYRTYRDGKSFLDLKRMIYDSVCAEKVSPDSIEICPLCTICNPSLFHSFRRDGNKSGRMFGIIGFREME